MASSNKVSITSIEGGNSTINAAEAADGVNFGGTAPIGSTLSVNGATVVVDDTGHWITTLMSPDQDGPWTVNAIATPSGGKPVNTSKKLVVDRSAPQVSIDSVEGGDDYITASEAAGGVVIMGSAEVGSSVKVNNKSVTVDTTGHWSIALKAPSADGDWLVNAVAKDAAGNITTSSTTTLHLQVKGPAVAFTTFEGGNTVINAAEAKDGVVIGGTTAAGSTVTVNGVAAMVNATGNWTATVPAPAMDGAFVLSAVATDSKGNASTITKTLTLDTTPPAVGITSINGGDPVTSAEAASGVAIQGTAEIGSALKVNGSTVVVDPTGHWSTTVTGSGTGGQWPVSAVATDAAGNSATTTSNVSVQGNYFNVKDFGAKGDGVAVDSDAINAAIKACHDAGGGTVYIPPGVYMVSGDHTNPSVGAIELLSNVTLNGAGMGLTTLKLVDNFNDRINGIVRTTLGNPGETVENATLSNLTIDGNRANNTGHQAAFISGAKDDGSDRIQQNITIDSVEAQYCTAYGFDPHEITTNITIKNSLAHNNGLDGFVADYLVNSVFENDTAYDNDRHGFNVQNQTTDFTLLNDTAYGNGTGATGGSGVTVQRGDVLPDGETSIPPDSHISITGGEFYNNSRSGILVKLADTTTVNGVNVHDNAREGVRVEGASNTVIENSTIDNNSTETYGAYDAVNIRSRDDSVSHQTVYSTNTSVHDNTIYATTSPSRYGIREEVTNVPDGSSSTTTLTDDPGTTASDNTISGEQSGAISVPNYTVKTNGTGGDDTLMGTAAGDYINGLGGNDLIFGYAGMDTLLGGQGDDTIDGGPDADSMVGGVGNDVYYVDHTGDVVTENVNEGTDKVFSTINYTLGSNVENLTLLGSSTVNGYGNELDNVLTGNDGANVLKSYAGNDTLDGGLGADTMTGGDGNDVYLVDNVGDVIVETQNNGLGGSDSVYSSVSYTLPDQVEALVLTGVGDLTATGNALSNVLVGNDGNNVLDGGAGPDTMAGGLGNDTYFVDHSGDVVSESLNGGIDQVNTTISTTLADNVENLTLLGHDTLGGTGNALDNYILGNDAANILKGMDGNDTLDGGVGADSMTGGSGNDVYIVDNPGDVVTESAMGGTDLVKSSVSYALSTNVENLTLTGTGDISATGNTAGNVLIGNNGNNTLDGGVGADTMIGGTGNNFFYVDNTGDVVVAAPYGGTDLVYSSISYMLGDNLENLSLTGNASINGTGNSLNNTITGNAGNNKLMGGLGSDFLTGGDGNDIFVYSSTNESNPTSYDTIADFTPQGHDKIDLSAIHTSNGSALMWGGQSSTAINNNVSWSYDGGGHAIVQADTNGDGVADFQLQLNGWDPSKTLTAADFKLK